MASDERDGFSPNFRRSIILRGPYRLSCAMATAAKLFKDSIKPRLSAPTEKTAFPEFLDGS
jgi:hypothetical protein